MNLLTRGKKRILSVLMSIVVLFTMMPTVSMPLYAAETPPNYLTFTAEEDD